MVKLNFIGFLSILVIIFHLSDDRIGIKFWQYSFNCIYFYREVGIINIKCYRMFFEPASARSYKIGVVGNNWLVCWLVGNAIFSETALRIFLIFYIKLEDYKARKAAEPDF